MTALSTLALVRIAHEAEDAGRLDAAEYTLADVAPDFEYVRRTVKRPHPRPYFEANEIDADEDWEPMSVADQRAIYRANWSRIDWLAWRSACSSSLSSTVYSSVVESLVAAYQYDDVKVTPYFRFSTVNKSATLVARAEQDEP